MGRIIFVLGLIYCSDVFSFYTVIDPTSIAKSAEILTTTTEALSTAKGIATTATEALSTANKTFGQMQTLNSVLGSPISSSIMGKLSGLRGSSSKYSGLFKALAGQGGSIEQAVFNFTGNSNIADFSRAKNYIQEKYFREKKPTISLGSARKIRYEREEKAKSVVVDSLVVTNTYKENMKEDQKNLEEISREAYESSDVNHQIIVQTKLLEKIAQSLEKLILLQSQQLEFMAHTYLGDRGVGLGEAKNPKEETR